MAKAVLKSTSSSALARVVQRSHAPMYYAQIALRGVPLSQGKHRVEMRYHTPLLAIGSSLSLLAVSLVLALIFSREQRGLEQREPKPGLDRRGA